MVMKYKTYLDLLKKWNNVYNLTSITDDAQMMIKHIHDSLSVSDYLDGENIIDVGTGAGLPGIVLAIAHPDKQFTLLDSNGKKTRFLTQAKAELKLDNVTIIHSRVEDYHPDHCFDIVISRAFSSIKNMLETTSHLGCSQGKFLAMKGDLDQKEIDAIPKKYLLLATHSLNVPGLNAKRHLVILGR